MNIRGRTQFSGEHTRLACCFWRLAENFSTSLIIIALGEGAERGTRGGRAPQTK